MAEDRSWLNELEGLRGLAAFWVFASHVALLVGFHPPLISWGGLGVDLFILISGFLMTHQYVQRRAIEPWSEPRTILRFWTRRFFRLAPLYYLLLLGALLFGAFYGDWRNGIAGPFPETATNVARYADHSLANWASHFSFLFGLLPSYAFATPLPDWSIGLEIQYYLVFPFLMLAVARLGYGPALATAALVAIAVRFPMRDYFAAFEMPSMLLLKLHLFMAGMAIAAMRYGGSRLLGLLAMALALVELVVRPGIPVKFVVIDLMMVAGLWALLAPNAFLLPQAAMAPFRRVLNHPAAQALGRVSYSLYLVHLLILLPIAAALAAWPGFAAVPAVARFALGMALATPPVLLAANGLYRVVEKPGIELGKRLLRAVPRRQVVAAGASGD
jgi:peptidoglycan/LPS O-acetylase OafA/YrhL